MPALSQSQRSELTVGKYYARALPRVKSGPNQLKSFHLHYHHQQHEVSFLVTSSEISIQSTSPISLISCLPPFYSLSARLSPPGAELLMRGKREPHARR
jgi:hypothetical protein